MNIYICSSLEHPFTMEIEAPNPEQALIEFGKEFYKGKLYDYDGETVNISFKSFNKNYSEFIRTYIIKYIPQVVIVGSYYEGER